jgi:hypothetical protein
MKILIVFIFFTFNSLAQTEKIGVDLLNNGQKGINTLSLSKINLITIEGTGCEEFNLTGSGNLHLTKGKNGYIVKVDKGTASGVIWVYGTQKGAKIALGAFSYKIIP